MCSSLFYDFFIELVYQVCILYFFQLQQCYLLNGHHTEIRGHRKRTVTELRNSCLGLRRSSTVFTASSQTENKRTREMNKGGWEMAELMKSLKIRSPPPPISFCETISSSPGWPRTHYVAEGNPELLLLLQLLQLARESVSVSSGSLTQPPLRSDMKPEVCMALLGSSGPSETFRSLGTFQQDKAGNLHFTF